jgi:Rod binding domain-containing protein
MDSSLSITASTGSAIQARATQVSRNLRAQGTDEGDSVTKSAREFEAVLLGHWLEDAEKTFASVPGSDPDKDESPGSDNYRSIGLQGVATSIANSGGIGIASMLVKYLNRTAAPVASQDGTHASNQAGPDKGASG